MEQPRQPEAETRFNRLRQQRISTPDNDKPYVLGDLIDINRAIQQRAAARGDALTEDAQAQLSGEKGFIDSLVKSALQRDIALGSQLVDALGKSPEPADRMWAAEILTFETYLRAETVQQFDPTVELARWQALRAVETDSGVMAEFGETLALCIEDLETLLPSYRHNANSVRSLLGRLYLFAESIDQMPQEPPQSPGVR